MRRTLAVVFWFCMTILQSQGVDQECVTSSENEESALLQVQKDSPPTVRAGPEDADCDLPWNPPNNNLGNNIPMGGGTGGQAVPGVTDQWGCRWHCWDYGKKNGGACKGWTWVWGQCYIKWEVDCMDSTLNDGSISGYCFPWRGPAQCNHPGEYETASEGPVDYANYTAHYSEYQGKGALDWGKLAASKGETVELH